MRGLSCFKVVVLLATLLLSIAFFTVSASDENGLVLYYRFDSIEHLKHGKVIDWSGMNNNGKVYGSPLIEEGFLGKCFYYDGEKTFVEVNLDVSWEQFTVEVWVMPAIVSSLKRAYDPRIIANSHTDVDYKGFQLAFRGRETDEFKPGQLFFDIGNGAGECRAETGKIGFTLEPLKWYHIVGVYDNKEVRLYVNGELLVKSSTLLKRGIDTKVPVSGAIAKSGLPIRIGTTPAYDYDYFEGKIDEVKIYKRALSDEEVKRNFELYATTQFLILSAPLEVEENAAVTIRGMLVDGHFNPIAGAKIDVYLNGEHAATITTNEDGVFSYKCRTGSAGELVSATFSYEGDDIRKSSCKTVLLKVVKERKIREAYLSLSVDKQFAGAGEEVIVEVTLRSGRAKLTGREVVVYDMYFGNLREIARVKLSESGKASIKVRLKELGLHRLQAAFKGDDEISPALSNIVEVLIAKREAREHLNMRFIALLAVAIVLLAVVVVKLLKRTKQR